MKLAYAIDGPPGAASLILLGSLGSTSEIWSAQVAAFAPRYQVIRFDLPGHGRSPVPRAPFDIPEIARGVLDTLDALGLQRVGFAGLSIGGMVGLWLAAHAPERISHLALLCSAARLDQPNLFLKRAQEVREHGSVQPFVSQLLPRWFTPAFLHDHTDVVSVLGDSVARLDAGGYAGCCEALARADMRIEAQQVRCATVVLGALQDGALPYSASEDLAALIPHARFVCLANSSHLAPVECPGEISSAIAELLSINA